MENKVEIIDNILSDIHALRYILLEETRLNTLINRNYLDPNWIETLDVAHGFAAKLYQVLIVLRQEYLRKLPTKAKDETL